ncbi:MAG: hypothetical protein Q8N26_01260 [Myxococcales bacterium]|nr:hypothetical protein [Myxococcales bacterium]
MFSRSSVIALMLGLSVAGCTCSREPPAQMTLKQETEACQRDEECATGLCEGAPATQPVCRRKCADGCKAQEVCTQLTPLRYACVADRGGLCQACQLDTDCPYPSDKCIVVNGENVCGRDCAFDQTCPTSYRCLNGVGSDGRAKAQQCTPSSGSCECTAANQGQTISCMNQNGFGTCSGSRTCDGVMGYTMCSAETPIAETCNAKDDDCDGQVDEGLPTVTCGLGQCQRTVPSCADGGTFVCTPGDAGVELCNGLDDDCDGTPDNGISLQSDVTNCGRCGNACMVANATPRCLAGQCEIGQCTAPFDDCNGRLTDGCEENTQTSVNHCGMCGRRCVATNATSSCAAGQCTFTCNPGFFDLDTDANNGCEYQCTFTSAVDLPDVAFVDANCDGMDGEVGNGVFVSLTGDDTNPGTREDPVLTIDEGIRKAVSQNKRDVYVSSGAFTGPLVITNLAGKNIAGGYQPTALRWTRASTNTTVVAGGNPALVIADAGVAVDAGVMVQFVQFRSDNATGVAANGNGNSSYGGRIVRSTGVRLELVQLRAGNGVAGRDGTVGAGGDDGNPGSVGVAGNVYDTTGVFGVGLCTGTAAWPTGAPGGSSTCGKPGGRGGIPGWSHNYSGTASDGNPFPMGRTGLNGVSGSSAGAGSNGNSSESASYRTAEPQQAGTAGAPGIDGANASAAAAIGALSIAGYLAPVTPLATNGTSGEGGGGGGGGGGGCTLFCPLGVCVGCRCYSYGSAGGGGGSGGCFGARGQSGGAGGASIGLVLFDAQVTARQLTVTTGSGGNGGRGAAGGAGGLRGLGRGSTHDEGAQGVSRIGGRGGDGGRGGRGGHGAGGAGGPVIGVARDGASVINTTQVTYSQPGTAGIGGSAEPGANVGPTAQTFQLRAF